MLHLVYIRHSPRRPILSYIHTGKGIQMCLEDFGDAPKQCTSPEASKRALQLVRFKCQTAYLPVRDSCISKVHLTKAADQDSDARPDTCTWQCHDLSK